MTNNKLLKHPKTYHLSFSQSVNSDDKIKKDNSYLIGQEVVVSLKLDGENTSLYTDYIHARSTDSSSNWTRDVAKKIHSVIKNQIPENWRLVCENLYAKHSIFYPDNYLQGYLYLLFIWDENNNSLHYDDEQEFADLLDLPKPDVLYRGVYDEMVLKNLVKTLDPNLQEGFVVRQVKPFHYNDFANCTAKYVRKGHVQDDSEHWLKNTYPNGLPQQPTKPVFMSKKLKNNL